MATASLSTRKRSIVKALSYRALIVVLDLLVIYVMTGSVKIAAGFMLISNIYTTLAYFLHERLWARVSWGLNARQPH